MSTPKRISNLQNLVHRFYRSIDLIPVLDTKTKNYVILVARGGAVKCRPSAPHPLSPPD